MPTATTILATWGAVVSTAAIIWNIIKDLNERGKLDVNCYIAEIVGSMDPRDKGSKLAYRVTNVGRRPIMVTHLGGALRKDKHFMINTQNQMLLPKMLQPGEYILEHTNDLSVLDEHPQELWAIDSTNRYWKFPKKRLRQLLKSHERK